MKFLQTLSLLVLCVLLATCVVFGQGNAAKGKELYAQKCASCHGPAGEGKDSVAKMFKVTLKPLSDKDVQAKSDADMKKLILEGAGKMKPIKISDAEAADVIAHVRTLKK